ncbi:hypothetical protein LUCX_111 [Xanthomonas phage vB_XciM_LucasX]|nr:hypothetical protein LUCX_111 [Xanthomonas phage vB_XciM_LucasX]
MTAHVKRAFVTTLESIKQEALAGSLEESYEFELPDNYPFDGIDSGFEAWSGLESLIESLRDAQSVGLNREQVQTLFASTEALQEHSIVGEILLPSLEAFEMFSANATEVSMEALRESVKRTIQAVLKAIAQFWVRLVDFVQDVLRSTALTRGRVAVVESRVRQAYGLAPKVDKVDVSGVILNLSSERVRAVDFRRLSQNLQTLHSQISNVRQAYVPMVTRLATEMLRVFEQWPTMDGPTWLARLNSIASNYDPARVLSAAGPLNPRLNATFGADALMAPALPGMKNMVIIPASGDAADLSTTEVRRAAALQNAQVVVTQLRPDSTFHEKREMMDVLPLANVEAIVRQVRAILDEIDATTRDDSRRVLRDMAARMDRLARSGLSIPDGQNMIFQAGINYARAVSRWCKEPYFSLIGHGVYVCNQTLRLCNAHLGAYLLSPAQAR